jgi:hypothetical protein
LPGVFLALWWVFSSTLPSSGSVLSVWYFDTWEGSYLSSFKNNMVGKKLGTQQQQLFGSDYSCSHALIRVKISMI